MSRPARSGEGNTLRDASYSIALRSPLPTYRRYIPGTGPRLRPITFLPRADNTAEIRDELLVPREITGDGKVHVVYLIGWTDLPAARITVDAEHVFDYVSPREYEKWSHEKSVEREELERQREEEENIRLVDEHIRAEEAKSAQGIVLRNGTLSINGSDSARTSPAPKRKPGRPRKVPSLSEPVPLEISSGFELTEPDTSNDEEAILRQLREEIPESLTGSDEDDDNESTSSSSPGPPMKKQRTDSPAQEELTVNMKPVGLKKETPVPIPRPPTRPSLFTGRVPIVPTNSFGAPSGISDSSYQDSSRSASLPTARQSHPGHGVKKPALPGPSGTQPMLSQKTPAKRKSREKMPKERPTDLVKFEPGQSWIVNRLLETKLFEDEDGNRVRHFLVLWKGDWPPDQNPTWEPEDNIPKAMARKFLLTHAANMGMDGVSDTPSQPPTSQERLFSSVSDAFSGHDDEDGLDEDTLRPEPDGEDEMLLVADEQPRRSFFQQSSLDWEMAMGRRFGESEGMAG